MAKDQQPSIDNAGTASSTSKKSKIVKKTLKTSKKKTTKTVSSTKDCAGSVKKNCDTDSETSRTAKKSPTKKASRTPKSTASLLKKESLKTSEPSGHAQQEANSHVIQASLFDGRNDVTQNGEESNTANVAQKANVERVVSDKSRIKGGTHSVKRKGASQQVNDNTLLINVSASLKRKLLDKARDEGISVDDFVAELLGEGLVLRAWEIAERKQTLKNPNGNANNYNSKNGYKQGGMRRNNNKKNSYNRIMDDNANFLEYVRNQEKRQR